MDHYINKPSFMSKLFNNGMNPKYHFKIKLFDGTCHFVDHYLDYDFLYVLNYYLAAPDVLFIEFSGFRIYSLNTLNDIWSRKTADNI